MPPVQLPLAEERGPATVSLSPAPAERLLAGGAGFGAGVGRPASRRSAGGGVLAAGAAVRVLRPDDHLDAGTLVVPRRRTVRGGNGGADMSGSDEEERTGSEQELLQRHDFSFEKRQRSFRGSLPTSVSTLERMNPAWIYSRSKIFSTKLMGKPVRFSAPSPHSFR